MATLAYFFSAENSGDVASAMSRLSPAHEVLLQSFAKGDERAFEMLYHEYHPRLHRYARSLTRSADLAEEVVHDVFLSLWDRRATVAVRDLTAYLFRAVRLRATDTIRHAHAVAHADREALARDVIHAADALVAERDAPDMHTVAAEIAEAVGSAIAAMPEARAAAARLRWVDGLTIAEVATVMEISVAAAQMHVSRAKGAIAAVLLKFMER